MNLAVRDERPFEDKNNNSCIFFQELIDVCYISFMLYMTFVCFSDFKKNMFLYMCMTSQSAKVIK